MTSPLAQPIRYPGERVAAGKRTDTPPPDEQTSEAFEEGLREIASAERDAANDSDLIHLA
jgi:hypothetical protein